jgi:3-methyladenine DNA glycosylase Tag
MNANRERDELIKSILQHRKKIKLKKQQERELEKIKNDLVSFSYFLEKLKNKKPPKDFSNDKVEQLLGKITKYEEEKCYRTLFDIYEVVETTTKPDWKEINECKAYSTEFKVFIEKIKEEMDFKNNSTILDELLK